MAQTKETAKKKTTAGKETKTGRKVSARTAKAEKETKTARSGKNLLIVESPSKAKTIKKYIGGKYEVLSSKGHIRDLPASRLGVDIEHDFTPDYIVSRKDGKSALLKELRKASEQSKKVYLATDPDREGEAIAWHLAELLDIPSDAPVRVTFNEITKNAVTNGVANPRTIDMDRVSAQQARRVLDRIVGYKLSPFLWKKVKKGLSAGRVQSVATRLVVDREREIEAFVPEEYWVLNAVFPNGKKTWQALFCGDKDGKKHPVNETEATALVEKLRKSDFTVSSVKLQDKMKQPNPPFTTSSMQQDASARLNMRPQRTMNVAQSLYEGVEVNGHTTGLITYMRTDSLRISAEAMTAVRDYITGAYGEQFFPKSPRFFKTRTNAQDAHEAIRPTDVTLAPEKIKGSLSSEQYRLYKLIWDRFVASQMSAAVYSSLSVEVSADAGEGETYIFRANDQKMIFPGFTTLYNYGEDEEKSTRLPELEQGKALTLSDITSEQRFTQPPSRYTEASLIKTLEENGIGRPSTYAPTISTIIDRLYVEKDGKSLKPTKLGTVTTDLMCENFKDIVDVSFTADMEEQLDEIEEGKKTYLDVMNAFYGDFDRTLKEAEKKLDGVRIAVPNEESDEVCEFCGRKMVYKNGRFGRFLACPGYPECKNTKTIVTEAAGNCPVCGSKMIIRKSKAGKTYYCCSKGPECKFMTWDLPVKDVCPKCGSTLFRHFNRLYCEKEGCGYETVVQRKTKAGKEKSE